METGDVVLLRSIYGGRVRWTFPRRVVATVPRLALHVCPGTPGKLMKRAYAKALAALQALGIFDEAAAVAVQAEGERLIAEWPLPTGWEDRRPEPSWPLPDLSADWHVV